MSFCPEVDTLTLYCSRQLPGLQMDAVREHVVSCSSCMELLCLDLPEVPPPEFKGLRILDRIGGGCFGAVYLAEQLSLQRQVAVKLVRDAYTEARQAARIDHPNVVRIYDTGLLPDASGGSYIVMQYVQGSPLREEPVPLAPARLRSVARQLAAGLDAIHVVGLVHRDLHLGNVLVRGEALTIIDFGSARCQVAPASGSLGPRRAFSPRDDIRAVGRILQYLGGETLAERDPSLLHLIDDCVSDAAYPKDGGELVTALNAAERRDRSNGLQRATRVPGRFAAARPSVVALLGIILIGGAPTSPAHAPPVPAEPKRVREQVQEVRREVRPVAVERSPAPQRPARRVGTVRERPVRACAALDPRCSLLPEDALAPSQRPCSLLEPSCPGS